MNTAILILMIYVSDGDLRNNFIIKNDSIAFYDFQKVSNVSYRIIKESRLYRIYECEKGLVIRITKDYIYLFDGDKAKRYKIIKIWQFKL